MAWSLAPSRHASRKLSPSRNASTRQLSAVSRAATSELSPERATDHPHAPSSPRDADQQKFREALLSLRSGSTTLAQWQLLYSRYRKNVSNDEEARFDSNAVHLYERDCTSQRRHQKLVEEAPAPNVDPKKRDAVTKSAADLIRSAKYCGAATVEFLMDHAENFYMLEVNTRVQVEHPVTEMITGVDIVKEQIKVAAGEPLSFTQKDIHVNGHAIECRINAEDPERDFAPSPGTITDFRPPGGMGVRFDSHVYCGYTVPSDYDSLLGKLIVHRDTRDQAIRTMSRALDEFVIEGVKTTVPFYREVLKHFHFVKGNLDTGFIEEYLIDA